MTKTLKITAIVLIVLTVLALYTGLFSEILQICEISAHTGEHDTSEHCKPWLLYLFGF